MLRRTATLTRCFVLLLCFLALAPFAFAATETTPETTTEKDLEKMGIGTSAPDTASHAKVPATENPGILVVKMFASLALVLALIVAAAWAFRRFQPKGSTPGGKSDAIRIVATKMLSGRRSLLLVRVRGQTLLLGMTPQNITTLTEIHEVEGEWAQPSEAASGSSAPPTAFNRRLGHLIEETIAAEQHETLEKKP